MPKAKTKVHFRAWPDGDIIALFPDDEDGTFIGSFQHIGQHSGASLSLVNELRVATPEEYVDLKQELESAPYHYNLEVLP